MRARTTGAFVVFIVAAMLETTVERLQSKTKGDETLRVSRREHLPDWFRPW